MSRFHPRQFAVAFILILSAACPARAAENDAPNAKFCSAFNRFIKGITEVRNSKATADQKRTKWLEHAREYDREIKNLEITLTAEVRDVRYDSVKKKAVIRLAKSATIASGDPTIDSIFPMGVRTFSLPITEAAAKEIKPGAPVEITGQTRSIYDVSEPDSKQPARLGFRALADYKELCSVLQLHFRTFEKILIAKNATFTLSGIVHEWD